MEILSEQQILELIRHRQPFSARVESGGYELRIERYQPMVVTAIHDGHRVLTEFADKMRINDDQRRFEEDPYTGDIAQNFSICMRVLDSRYCCDLNRDPQSCIYDEAWGRQVWKAPLEAPEKQRLLEHHASYYRILDELLSVLTESFGSSVLYDLHSYNYRRLNGEPPLFNIGTHFIDLKRFGSVIDHLVAELGSIELADCTNRAVVDEVFAGKGYQAEFVHRRHPDVLCVPLEIKKVFMDEASLELKEEVFNVLRQALSNALERNHKFFNALNGSSREKR